MARRQSTDHGPQLTLVPPPIPKPPSANLTYVQAYELVLPAARAIPADELLEVDLGVAAAAVSVMSAEPQILALRQQARAIGCFDISNSDQLRLYAMAAYQADVRCASGPLTSPEFSSLAERCVTLRDAMYAGLVRLREQGSISAAELRRLKPEERLSSLGFDLPALAMVLQRHWDEAPASNTVLIRDFGQAELLAYEFMTALGTHEHAVAEETATRAHQRRRNFTLLVRAYTQVRRAVGYIRFTHGDADRIAPPLYVSKPRKPTRYSIERSAIASKGEPS